MHFRTLTLHVITVIRAVATSKYKDNIRYKVDDEYVFRDLFLFILMYETHISKYCMSFSVEGQIVNILGSLRVSDNYSAWPLQCKNSHKHYANEWAWLCPNNTLLAKIVSSLGLVCGP